MTNSGSVRSDLSPDQVIDRLCPLMAGANFEITHKSSSLITFKHGTYLTQTATLVPKKGSISIVSTESGSELIYEIEVDGFAKYWMMFVGILFCWLIFPPILIYRALKHHPNHLMRNLLQAV